MTDPDYAALRAALECPVSTISFEPNNRVWRTTDTFQEACTPDVIARLLAELDGLLADAARYRWLRANGEPDAGMAYRPDWTPTMLDEAIDAAMKAKP